MRVFPPFEKSVLLNPIVSLSRFIIIMYECTVLRKIPTNPVYVCLFVCLFTVSAARLSHRLHHTSPHPKHNDPPPIQPFQLTWRCSVCRRKMSSRVCLPQDSTDSLLDVPILETLQRRHSDVKLGSSSTQLSTPGSGNLALPKNSEVRRHSDVSPASIKELEKVRIGKPGFMLKAIPDGIIFLYFLMKFKPNNLNLITLLY